MQPLLRFPTLVVTCSVATMVLLTAGCASKHYVDQQVTELDTRSSQTISQVQGLAQQNQADIQALSGRVNVVEQTQASLSSRVATLGGSRPVYNQVAMTADVFFEFGQSRLTAEARARLDALVVQLAKSNYTSLHISGHTDSIGGERFNFDLGRRRAEVVNAYLAQRGLERHKLHISTLGEAMPVASNSSASERAHNRRVEIRIIQLHTQALPPG